jgi:NRPS condensation-like uncharacterized protein
MAAATEHRKPGRRSKGERKFIGFRLEEDRAKELAAVAKAEGITVNELVAELVAEGMSSWDSSRTDLQGELPIGQMAS